MTKDEAIAELKGLLGVSLKFSEHEAIGVAIATLSSPYGEPIAVVTAEGRVFSDGEFTLEESDGLLIGGFTARYKKQPSHRGRFRVLVFADEEGEA